MSSSFGDKLKVSIFGESHSAGIGVVIDGIPAGEEIDLDELYAFMSRRRAKKDGLSTPRIEADIPEIMSGILNGKTTGTPICAVIKNTNTRSGDYSEMSQIARPGHADYTGFVRYSGFGDIRGGGHFSGRPTAPLCFVGGICKQILAKKGITIGAHALKIAGVCDTPFDSVAVTKELLDEITHKEYSVIDDSALALMKEKISQAREEGDSVGGIIEAVAVGVPAGVGTPIYDGLENVISSLMFSIPAVKGIEFGAGFAVADMKGSENNDEFYIENGVIKTKTNNCGGILGGISNGMPILTRVAIKPTPSISKQQKSINFVTNQDAELSVKGRHDPCIALRAVPCVESAMALAILSQII
ncbi:MAG: chorismate synthase [Oscillospiraceae bacterium]|nr:chorismate synthase [Oscillospiraceae bacterium]